MVQVRLHRLGQLVAVLDSLETGVQQRRERQVGIARRIRATNLRARRLLGAGLVQRDPDQRGTVPPRPRDVHWRLVSGDEALVRVDPLREHRRDLACVAELAGDECLADLREMPLIVLVEERVPAAGEQRLMRVHAGPVLAEDGLRHESRVVAVLLRDLFDDQTVSDRVIGHRQCRRVAHVDLVL